MNKAIEGIVRSSLCEVSAMVKLFGIEKTVETIVVSLHRDYGDSVLTSFEKCIKDLKNSKTELN